MEVFYTRASRDRERDKNAIFSTWTGQRKRQKCNILYLDRTELETKIQHYLPGEDKDGDSVADEPENADPVKQHPGNPELEDGVVHLIRRRVLQRVFIKES